MLISESNKLQGSPSELDDDDDMRIGNAIHKC